MTASKSEPNKGDAQSSATERKNMSEILEIGEALQAEGQTLAGVTGVVSRVFDRKTGRSRTGKFWSCQTMILEDMSGVSTRATFWGQEPLAFASGDIITVNGQVEVKVDEYLSEKNNERTLCLDVKQGAKIMDAMGADMNTGSDDSNIGSKPYNSRPQQRSAAPRPAAQAPANPQAKLNQLAHLMKLCIEKASTVATEVSLTTGLEFKSEDVRSMGIGLWIDVKGTAITSSMPTTPIASTLNMEDDGQ